MQIIKKFYKVTTTITYSIYSTIIMCLDPNYLLRGYIAEEATVDLWDTNTFGEVE